MITLHDMKQSGNCYKVRLLLALLGIPFKSIAIEPSAGQSSTPEFLAKNPKGSVPFVEFENNETLSESNAILLHFAEDTRYMPKDKFLRAKAYEWLFFEQYYHEPNIAVRISLSTIAARQHQATEEKMTALLEGGNHALNIMEGHLQNNRYLVSDMLTVADICLYAYTHKAASGGFSLSDCPAVSNWLGLVEAEDGFVKMNWLPSNI